MPVINQQQIDINTGFQTVFQSALETDKVENIDVIATRIMSDSSAEQYPALVGVPGMEEFQGEAEFQNLVGNNYIIQNKDYHASVQIPENAYNDDKTGSYKAKIQEMGENAKAHPWKLLVELLNKAFKEKDYTGKPFISTDKPYVPGVEGLKVPTFSNKGTKKLTEASLGEAIATFKELKDPFGNPLYAGFAFKPVLIIPAALEMTAKALIEKDKENGNPLYGSCEIRVIAGLNNPNCWFLADLSRSCKPFIFQDRESPEMISNSPFIAGGNYDTYFMKTHTIVYQVKARCAMSYGASSRIWGSDGSTAG